MINFLNDIRNAENPISNNRKLINTIAILFLGIALGTFSKYLDFRQTELPGVLMAINGVLDIITRMDNVLEGMRDNLEQHQTVLGNLLQQMEDAKVEVKRPFPQEAELAEKSERLAALNVALNIGGKDKPNSRERQKHDGKTSIKRLLRRMGVESAASAAPKKDKEMEVAI